MTNEKPLAEVIPIEQLRAEKQLAIQQEQKERGYYISALKISSRVPLRLRLLDYILFCMLPKACELILKADRKIFGKK